MSKLARLIGQREGFGIPGAIPTLRNNPGDLEHAPGASHEGIGANSVGIEPDAASGWSDLDRQLQLFAQRGLTLAQMADEYWPEPANDTASCLQFICDGLPMDSWDTVTEALTIP